MQQTFVLFNRVRTQFFHFVSTMIATTNIQYILVIILESMHLLLSSVLGVAQRILFGKHSIPSVIVTFGYLISFPLVSQPSQANQGIGLVVRVSGSNIEAEQSIQVTFEDLDGGEKSVVVSDDGKNPDLLQGDGTYTCTALLLSTVYSITVQVDDKAYQAKGVDLSSGTGPMDLEIAVNSDTVTVDVRSVGAGGMNVQQPDTTGGGTALQTAKPGSPPTQETAAGSSIPVVTTPKTIESSSTSTNDPFLWAMSLFFGLLSILGAGLLVQRFGIGRKPGIPQGLTRLFPAGFLHPENPPAIGQQSHWLMPKEDSEAFLQHFLTALSGVHTVVIFTTEETHVPKVTGTSIFRSTPVSALQMGDWADALERQSDRSVVFVMLGEGASEDSAEDIADSMPTGTGVMWLATHHAPEVETLVRVQEAENGWRYSMEVMPNA